LAAKTKANEDEFKGQVIHWIKKQIAQGGLPFENAINDPSLSGLPTVRFPDVLITLDEACEQPFCGWELKTPTTNVRDKKLLKDAVEKAQTLKAKYFVTWNMQTAIIWRTPEGTRATVNEEDKVRDFPLTVITSVDDIRDPIKAILLEDLCTQLLRDLERLYHDENINLPIADTTVFVGLVGNAAEQMAECLSTDLNRARGNKAFDSRLRAWATKQGVSKYDQDYYHTLSQQISYKIIGKILFYMTLRRNKLDLPRMELPAKNYKTAINKMRGLFQQALEVDYQAIFEPDITDEIELSADTAKIIIDLTEKLTHWTFELMPLDVIGNVFEKLIPEDARHSLGQYFTPDNLVDLIVAFCIRNGNDSVMDPTCGTGTFLIRGYNRLRHLGIQRKPHHELLNHLWGFDIAGFPAELATINLCRQDFSDYLNFPRVLANDFFDVMPGDSFEFPPPKKTAKTGERVKVKIPEFNALVGNFPFIRQELIEKVEKGYKKKLEEVLFESWGKEYPELFRAKVAGAKNKTTHNLQLSGQADIYAYMFFHSAAHLKVGGRMGFVTSNSWLDVAYGYELQKFFLSKFKLVAICESRCEPWFEQSAVNTVFTILERSDDFEANKNNLVRFVKLKKPLKELFPENVLTDAQARWIRLEKFVARIEGIAATGKISEESGCRKFNSITKEQIRQPEIISCEDEDIRVRMIRQEDLRNEIERASQTVKWGQYLRAPDIYFEILEKCADKFVPLAKVADIRFGIKTGINEFFYLDDDKIKHWGIEKEFLKPVIKSPKDSSGIRLKAEDLQFYAFLCHKDKSELRGTNALKYIKWGESQKTDEGKLWPEVESVSGRGNWYELPKRLPSLVLLPMVSGSSLRCILNPCKAQVDHNLFEIVSNDKDVLDALGIYLNSETCFLQRELIGRANLGDGALKVEGIDWERILVPDKDRLLKLKKDAGKVFEKVCKRNIEDIKAESRKKDRIEFEKTVLESLGLPSELAEQILAAVVGLVEERHLLPKMRNSKKKKRKEQDWGKLKEEIIEEILPNVAIKFPDGFVKDWPKVDFKEISVPAGVLKLGESFFDRQQICDEEGTHLMDVGSEIEGKFIVYAKKKDEFVVKIPNRLTVIGKAVKDYEIYLKELKQKLYKAFMEKCGDHNLSENLTREVFDDFKLHYL
jgi:type I restriction enzyme M protein